MKNTLSIVIPCKNENFVLIETLHCLLNQKGIEDVSIIIADCSTDNTRSLVELFARLSKLNVVLTDGGLPTITTMLLALTVWYLFVYLYI